MRQHLSKVLLTTFLFSVLLVIQGFTSSPTKDISLTDAIKNNLLIAKITSNGKHSGNSINIFLSNNSSSTLNVKIPAGTLFNPEDNEEQTLIHLNDDFIALKPHGTYTGKVSAFCTESSDRCPTSTKTMKISANKNPKMTSMINYMKGKPISKMCYQDAVWAISDGHSITNIPSEDVVTKDFRTYLAKLTGQKDSWFTSPQNVQIDEEGNFNHETVSISGRLEFECEKGASVRQDIYKENGDVVFVSDKYMTVRTGHVTYKFNMRVRGWEKGNYYIRIHDGTNDIAKYPFEV